MSDTLKTTYKNVEIEYRESANAWFFEIGGKEKSAENLRAAKLQIDAAPKKKIEKWEAYEIGDDHEHRQPAIVSVGAQVEDYRSRPAFWIKRDGEQKRKISRMALVKITPANDAKLAEIRRLQAEIDKLDEEQADLETSLERVDLRE
jgi:hypothetical protein